MQLYVFTAWDLHQSPYEQYAGLAGIQNSMQIRAILMMSPISYHLIHIWKRTSA